ncbi:hypothetical protein ACHAXS_002895 [Conticribra weissflogii]
MLIVYEDQYAMEEAENEKGYTVEGFPSYYHSGLTPPMRRVVRRRFLSRFEERDTKPIPPHRSEVAEVEKEIQELIAKLSGERGKGKLKKGASSSSGKDRVIEEVEEEIIDYEPWMGDGGTFSLEDAKMHPEWWLTREEIKQIEIEEAIRAEKEKQEREEEKARAAAEAAAAAAAAAARAAEMPLASPTGEDGKKKKKKKDKKKKKKHEEEEEVLEMDEGVKGIQPLKSREDQQLDEVTQAAMTISQGVEDEDLLLGDDMFDFDGEDFADLM